MLLGNHTYTAWEETRYGTIALMTLVLSSGCVTRRPVTFTDGDDLLKAASRIQVGDTRNEVVCYLGWRRDQGLVEAAYFSLDDGGGMIHPRIAFWSYRVYPVSLHVDFTDNGRVYRIRYYDDRKKPDGPYMMIGPRNATPTEQVSVPLRSKEDDYVQYAVATGKVAPGQCWRLAPDVLYHSALRSKGWDKDGFFASQAGGDRFYKAYAQPLRPIVDIRYPKAREYRAALVSAFRQITDFDAILTHGGGTGHGHTNKRIPAIVEYHIAYGFQHGFHANVRAYSYEDLTALSEILIRGKHQILGPEDIAENKKKLRDMFAKALSSLADAEAHMPDQEVKYWRREVLRWTSTYL